MLGNDSTKIVKWHYTSFTSSWYSVYLIKHSQIYWWIECHLLDDEATAQFFYSCFVVLKVKKSLAQVDTMWITIFSSFYGVSSDLLWKKFSKFKETMFQRKSFRKKNIESVFSIRLLQTTSIVYFNVLAIHGSIGCTLVRLKTGFLSEIIMLLIISPHQTK